MRTKSSIRFNKKLDQLEIDFAEFNKIITLFIRHIEFNNNNILLYSIKEEHQTISIRDIAKLISQSKTGSVWLFVNDEIDGELIIKTRKIHFYKNSDIGKILLCVDIDKFMEKLGLTTQWQKAQIEHL